VLHAFDEVLVVTLPEGRELAAYRLAGFVKWPSTP
jgi:hypothetical protein